MRWRCRGIFVAAGTSFPAMPALADGLAGIGNAVLPRDMSPWSMFLNADSVLKAVVIGLALASIVTWTVGLAKGVELHCLRRRLRRDLGALEEAAAVTEAMPAILGNAPGHVMLVQAAAELSSPGDTSGHAIKERIASRLERAEAAAGRTMSRGTGILASIGSTAPFVGLFGTVWGIMNSFIGISKAQTTNLAVVAPGIAEALLATAIGLVAAIPAVVIYNLLVRNTLACRALVSDVAAAVMRLASRDLDRMHRAQRLRPAAE